MKDGVTVTFKPTCECGYSFKRITFGYDTCDYTFDGRSNPICAMYSGFDPACCPNCGRRINGFVIPIVSLDKWEFEESEE